MLKLMTQASWLNLLVCGRGHASLLHHPKPLIFFHWLNLLRYVYIHSSETGSRDFLHYNIMYYVMVFEWKQWGWLYHWLSLTWTIMINWYMVPFYNPSKHLTWTKPVAHTNVSAFLWSIPLYLPHPGSICICSTLVLFKSASNTIVL